MEARYRAREIRVVARHMLGVRGEGRWEVPTPRVGKATRARAFIQAEAGGFRPPRRALWRCRLFRRRPVGDANGSTDAAEGAREDAARASPDDITLPVVAAVAKSQNVSDVLPEIDFDGVRQ